MAFEGVAYSGHAVVRGVIVHLGKHLALPVDAIAHPENSLDVRHPC